MKLVRVVVLVLVIAIVGALVWRSSPGCRQRARDAYRRYGGWTEEARREDPVGFIGYAEKELTEDLDTLNETRRSLAEAQRTVEAELEQTRSFLRAADELAEAFRQAYQQAEASSAYPVEVAGTSYQRKDLVEQVALILQQKQNYEQIIEGLQRAAGDVTENEPKLVAQINSTKAALATLPSKREIARISQLTGRTEELLAQVNDLIAQNEDLLGGSPVRTVEELVRAQEAPADTQTGQIDAEAFLEGEE